MTSVTKNKFGFMTRRLIMEVIFLVRKLMKRYREQKNDLHMVFIDLEKVYDKILWNVMWWTLEKHKAPTKYITLIKDMYDNVVTSVRTSDGDIDNFSIKIGLHQAESLSVRSKHNNGGMRIRQEYMHRIKFVWLTNGCYY